MEGTSVAQQPTPRTAPPVSSGLPEPKKRRKGEKPKGEKVKSKKIRGLFEDGRWNGSVVTIEPLS